MDDCVGATSSTIEDLNQFITTVNSFHPALKYTWEISDSSLAFLDIKVKMHAATVFAPVSQHHHLRLLLKRAIITPNKLINSQHYKRHRGKIEFHSPSEPHCDSKIHHPKKL